jgi:hypothetical protein
MKQLIEDYKRKIKTLTNDLRLYKSTGSINDIKKVERLTTKLFEYRAFVTELERLNVQNDNVQPITKQFPDFIARVDFKTLRTQKATLIKIIDEYELATNKEVEAEDLTGVLNLIDALQNYAVDVIGMNPMNVYDFELEEGRTDVVKPEKKNYFEIMHSGYQKNLLREEIQIHGGENANIFLIKTDEGFVVDVYGQNDIFDTMSIFEDDLNPDSDVEEDMTKNVKWYPDNNHKE